MCTCRSPSPIPISYTPRCSAGGRVPIYCILKNTHRVRAYDVRGAAPPHHSERERRYARRMGPWPGGPLLILMLLYVTYMLQSSVAEPSDRGTRERNSVPTVGPLIALYKQRVA